MNSVDTRKFELTVSKRLLISLIEDNITPLLHTLKYLKDKEEVVEISFNTKTLTSHTEDTVPIEITVERTQEVDVLELNG